MSGYRTDAAISRGVGYTVVEDASLEGRNTFRVPARASLLIDVKNPDALPALFDLGAVARGPLLVLGEGSNVLFTRDWPGVVMSISAIGIAIVEDRGEDALVRVAAGESWNDLVRWSLAKGFAGLENLVLIPGTVGAAPIQNIGAYGVELREFVREVEAFDRTLKRSVRLSNSDCAFAYRDSIFKRERDRFIVTAVTFALSRERAPQTGYAGVVDELKAIGANEPTPVAVAEAIARIRMRKLPNPALIGNAGSFFKNPIVSAARADAIRCEHPTLVAWPAAEGLAKLSAAWLVEQSGFKGVRDGAAGVSDQHALVLVNHGGATGAEIWALAERVRAGVADRFGVEIEPEPLIV